MIADFGSATNFSMIGIGTYSGTAFTGEIFAVTGLASRPATGVNAFFCDAAFTSGAISTPSSRCIANILKNWSAYGGAPIYVKDLVISGWTPW